MTLTAAWPQIVAGAVLLLVFVVNLILWRLREATGRIDVDRAMTQSIAGVSVLAIGVPIVVDRIIEPVRASGSAAVANLGHVSLLLAAVSLISGAFLITFLGVSSPSRQDEYVHEGKAYVLKDAVSLEITKKNWWYPLGIAIQLWSLVLFVAALLTSAAMVSGQAEAFSIESPNTRFTIAKKLPPLGTSKDELLRSWGSPTDSIKGGLVYVGSRSRLTFCFDVDTVASIFERGVDNAVEADCR